MDQTALELVIRRYADTVYRLAYAHMRNPADADDVFQDVFLRYAEKAPAFADEEHRKAWLIRVTVNRCRSHYRSGWWKRIVPLENAADAAALPPADPVLAHALDQLPPKYRTVIHLHYFENYTTDEIAELFAVPSSTVRTQLARGRRLLGKLLKGEYDD